jgi:hypothetical protein
MEEPTVAVWNRARMANLVGLSTLFFAVGVLVLEILLATKGMLVCHCCWHKDKRVLTMVLIVLMLLMLLMLLMFAVLFHGASTRRYFGSGSAG